MNAIRGLRAIGVSLLLTISVMLESCTPQALATPAAAPKAAPQVTAAPTQVSTVKPTPTQAPTPTPYPVQEFKSSRFGYSVSLPVGWNITEKPGKWDGKLVDESGDAGTDTYGRPGDDVPPLEIGVLAVKAGTTTKQWADSEAGSLKFPDCTAAASMDPTTVGGSPGLVQHITCRRFKITHVYLVHGDQGYMFSWASEGAVSPVFAAALASVKFR